MLESTESVQQHSVSWSQYFAEALQLRSITQNRSGAMVLIGSWVAIFVVYMILLFGRPTSTTYWDTFPGEPVSLTLCEAPREDEFTRMPANALSSMASVYLATFMLILFMLDLKDARHYFNANSQGFNNAAILLRYPLWSLWLGANFMLYGISGLVFFASNLSVPKIFFDVSQWATILALCLCSVHRLVDPPVKTKEGLGKGRRIAGNILLLLIFIFHISISLLLLQSIRAADNSSSSTPTSPPVADTNDVNITGSPTPSASGNNLEIIQDFPAAILYGLVVLGVVCAIFHWRLHALSIEQQPVLMFLAGVIAAIAAGIDSYDDNTNSFCKGGSFFQLRPIGVTLLHVSAMLTYLFFRGDRWRERKLDTKVRIKRYDPSQVARDQLMNAAEHDAHEVLPEPLNRISQRRDQQAQQQVSQMRRLTAALRTTSAQVAESRFITPEQGFTSTEIRSAEVFIGLLIIAFIVVVIYFTFRATQ